MQIHFSQENVIVVLFFKVIFFFSTLIYLKKKKERKRNLTLIIFLTIWESIMSIYLNKRQKYFKYLICFIEQTTHSHIPYMHSNFGGNLSNNSTSLNKFVNIHCKKFICKTTLNM